MISWTSISKSPYLCFPKGSIPDRTAFFSERLTVAEMCERLGKNHLHTLHSPRNDHISVMLHRFLCILEAAFVCIVYVKLVGLDGVTQVLDLCREPFLLLQFDRDTGTLKFREHNFYVIFVLSRSHGK